MTTIQRAFVSLDSPSGARLPVGSRPCQGLYYTPRGSVPTVAFIAAHYNADFSEHYLAPRLAERGFGFLGWNTRFRGNEAFFLLEHALVDIGVGVDWLRGQGVRTVVLLGNSGGGSLMGAYQSQADEVTLVPTPGSTLPAALGELSAGDLYISLNAHAGRPEVFTAWMDPSVVDENDPLGAQPDLDMYDPSNGPPYSASFIHRYRAAQVVRNERITAWVHTELARITDAGHFDRAFNVYRTWADPRMMDPTLDPSARSPRRCYAGDPRAANYGPRGLGLTNTLRTWLSMWSLADSHCRGAPHLARIQCPALVIQGDADTGIFPSDAEAIHAALGARDKTLAMIEGDHYLQHPEGAGVAAADRIARWVGERC